MKEKTANKGTVAILCAGGPAPGINAVIASLAKVFLLKGFRVMGIHSGYLGLLHPEKVDPPIEFNFKKADRIHSQGGSILRMSRYRPADDELNTDFLTDNNVTLLVTIGGDDTASTASRFAKFLSAKKLKASIIHVPKTIDNDLPLPSGHPTFGYRTAIQIGTEKALAIYEDARTTGIWFVLSAMGREAGHLAFAIAKASQAAMGIVPEMFKNGCTVEKIVRLMVSSVIKRKILGIDHGIIIISEGVFHVISDDELLNCGIEFSKDEHGHPELGNISKGQLFNTLLLRRLKELGIKFKSHPADIGFEMRCAKPIASDLSFCTSLGLGVYKLFKAGYSDCMVSISNNGDFVALNLEDLESNGGGKLRVRLLDFESEVVRETYDYIFHYLTADDYEAARKYLPHPEEYDFNKIIQS